MYTTVHVLATHLSSRCAHLYIVVRSVHLGHTVGVHYLFQVPTCTCVMPVCTHAPIESFQCPDSTEDEKMLAYVSRQVAQKWTMLARYAGLEEDDIEEIKRAPAEDRCRAAMKKIHGRLAWKELLGIVYKHVSYSATVKC